MYKKSLYAISLLLITAAFSSARADQLDDFIEAQIKIRKIPVH